MADIILSKSVRANLSALQSTANLISQTQNRLATGKRVNSALDNPLNFFTSQSLNSRAGDLNALLDSVSNAVQTLQAADNGITSLTKLVQSAQAIAQQAQQSAATTAKYTGTVSGLTSATTGTFTAANTITVNDGTTTATFTAAGTSADTVGAFISAVNANATLKVKAELSSDGKVLLEATGTNTIVIGGTSTVGEKAQWGLVAGTTAAGTLNTTRSSLATQYDALRTQIDQLAADSGYNGVNLLNGDGLKVVFNEKGTSSQSISGVTFNAAGLGVAASTNTFQTDKDLADAITNINTALSTLRSQASAFGSSLSVVQTRQDFTKSMIGTLKTGADNLVLADFERRRREPARVADPPAAVLDRPVARRAGRSERAAPVRLNPARPSNTETAGPVPRRFLFLRLRQLDSAKPIFREETTMALKVELKPGERILIGEAVVTNSDQRTRLLIEGAAPILREKDIMTLERADTPAKRIYLAVQLMYTSREAQPQHELYFSLVRDIVQAAPSTWPLIEAINNHILTGELYKALKDTKKLIAYEEELLNAARGGSGLRQSSKPNLQPT